MARSRSRSPGPRTRPKPEKGFRWKAPKPKPAPDRAPSPDRPSRRERDYDARDRARTRDASPDNGAARSPPSRARDDAPPSPPPAGSAGGVDIAAKFGTAAARSFKPAPRALGMPAEARAPDHSRVVSGGAEGAARKARGAAAPAGPMMLVTVNDRLGTKAQIPCLGSDTVGDFKKLVASKIGRKTHEILIKRQSERPFKDMLTLDDYGVSNGVQLDLELDTGD